MPTLIIWTALFLSFLATAFSIFALYAMSRSSTHRLYSQLAALSEAQDSLNVQLRSVKVRLSALSKPRKDGKFATADDAGTDEGLPDARENPLEWKRRMNLRLAMKGAPK